MLSETDRSRSRKSPPAAEHAGAFARSLSALSPSPSLCLSLSHCSCCIVRSRLANNYSRSEPPRCGGLKDDALPLIEGCAIFLLPLPICIYLSTFASSVVLRGLAAPLTVVPPRDPPPPSGGRRDPSIREDSRGSGDRDRKSRIVACNCGETPGVSGDY